jgi:hypothetical protein
MQTNLGELIKLEAWVILQINYNFNTFNVCAIAKLKLAK